jgi:hypothetical protein
MGAIFNELFIFPRGILGGIGAVLVMWIAIIATFTWRLASVQRAAGLHGNVGMAGGWRYLCHSPIVIVLLAVAFGLGFYLATRH